MKTYNYNYAYHPNNQNSCQKFSGQPESDQTVCYAQFLSTALWFALILIYGATSGW